MNSRSPNDEARNPLVPGYRLIRCIGSGSSGKVWLAQCEASGEYHGVKVVFRASFTDEKPYLRELHGIRKFEPISKTHPGFVHIHRVSEDREQGCFHYIMELADGVGTGPFHPDHYQPRTVDTQVREGSRFSVDQVLETGLRLSDALHFLHENGLVHRDIKPANLLFVAGRPKLADIGLVIEREQAQSLVGTPGYIPPEGPGSNQADVFALGKVLYECLTGLDRTQFPELPSFLDGHLDHDRFLEVNGIVVKACHPNPQIRYATARQMHADLAAVENGQSIVRLRHLEHRIRQCKRIARIAAVLIVSLALAGWFVQREFQARDQERQRTIGAMVRDVGRGVEGGDYGDSLWHMAAALKLQPPERIERLGRIRFGTILDQLPKLTLFQCLDSSVNWCGFAKDDRVLLVGLGDGRCQIRDSVTGAVLRELLGHGKRVNACAIAADGTTFLTAGEDATARVWDAVTGKERFRMDHPQVVRAVAYRPERRQIATGCDDGKIRIWDGETGAFIKEVPGHSKAITAIRFSHGGGILATGSRDGLVRLWHADTTEPVGEPIKHANWVNALAFSPDDRQLVTTCADHFAYVWAVTSGSLVMAPLRHQRGVRFAEFSPEGSTIVTAGWDDMVCIWDAATGELLPPALRHSSPLVCAGFSQGAHQVVTGCTDGTLRVWNLAGRNLPRRLEARALDGDGNLFLRWEEDRVDIFAISDPAQRRTSIHIGAPVERAFLNHDGTFVAVIENDPQTRLRVWNVSTRTPGASAISLTNASSRLYFDRVGSSIARIDNNALTIYGIASGVPLFPPIVKNERIEAIGFDHRGERFALASSRQVEIRDVATGRLIVPPLVHDKQVKAAIFSPDSRSVVTCTSDNSVGGACYSQVWDVSTGASVGPPLWHRDGVLGAVWGPPLITYSEDGLARIWSVPGGAALGSDLNHRDQLTHVSLRGELALTGSLDRSARIWDALSGDPISPPYGFPGSVRRTWLDRDQGHFLIHDSSGAYWLQPLRSIPEPAPVLSSLADVMAGRSVLRGQTDETTSAKHLASLWEDLRARMPAQFAVSHEEHLNWLRWRAEQLRRRKLGESEQFFLNQISKLQAIDRTSF